MQTIANKEKDDLDKITFGVNLPRYLISKLDDRARSTDRSRSSVIREILSKELLEA